jgi:uncharacterized protein (DUF927 family)
MKKTTPKRSIRTTECFENLKTRITYATLRFLRLDGERDYLTVPLSDLIKITKLRDTLTDREFAFPQDTAGAKKLCDQLRVDAARIIGSGNKGFKTPTIGYTDDKRAFVLPSETVGSEKLLFVAEDSNVNAIKSGRSGTFRDWQQGVAERAVFSSRIMLSICAALSAPLLRHVEPSLGSYGFDFTDRDSSKGKSTSVRAGWSVIGGGRLRNWGATRAGIVQAAQGHNDCPLVLDEARSARARIAELTYVLSSGEPDTINRDYQTAPRGINGGWNTVVLSTSEGGLGEARAQGEQARMICVPASPEGSQGVFDYTRELRTKVYRPMPD